MSATLTVPQGGDLSFNLTIAKNRRTRLSDYSWRAHLRTGATSPTILVDLTQTNGGLTIVDDLGGVITVSLTHGQTDALEPDTYVLDLRAENIVTGLVEFTDPVTVTITLPITQL